MDTTSTAWVSGNPTNNEQKSWTCHRCLRVNAPWKSSCDCTNSVGASPMEYPQNWPRVDYQPCILEAARRAHPEVQIWGIACPCPRCSPQC